MQQASSPRRRLSLVRFLLTLTTISIFVLVAIIAINPVKQMQYARNAQRYRDVNVILSAVYQFAVDHNGRLPTIINAKAENICQSKVVPANGICQVSLDFLSTEAGYLEKIPIDPLVTQTGTGSRYTIQRTTENRVKICAYASELGETICMER